MLASNEYLAGQYQYSDVPPFALIGMYKRQLWDNPAFFQQNIQTHLLSAFNLWRNHLELQDLDVDARNKFNWWDRYVCNGFVGRLKDVYDTSMLLRSGNGISLQLDPDKLPYDRSGFDSMYRVLSALEPELFFAEVAPAQNIEYSAKNIVDGFSAFESLLTYKYWEKLFRETSGQIPFAMEFPQATIALLPEIIAIGEIVWKKVFDRYMLPTFVNQPIYRNQFYTHLGEKYQQEVDMQIKNGVFERLYKLIPGNNMEVLDAACGPGLANEQLPQGRTINLTGLDENELFVSLANDKGESSVLGRIEDASTIFQEKRFDAAFMSFWECWETEQDKPIAFQELKKIVKVGGRVVFNVHKPQDDWQEKYRTMLMDQCGYKSVSFSQEEIERTGGGVYTAYYVVAEV